VFFGSNKHIAMQIGNAVPVRLAEQIGKHILYICRHEVRMRGKGRGQVEEKPSGNATDDYSTGLLRRLPPESG